jgi:hypothetical protein
VSDIRHSKAEEPNLVSSEMPCYQALEAADGDDMRPLEALMAALLAKQLLDVHQAAISNGDSKPSERKLH